MFSINLKMARLVILVLLNHDNKSWNTDSLPLFKNHLQDGGTYNFPEVRKKFPHQIRTYFSYQVLANMVLHTAKGQSISDTCV